MDHPCREFSLDSASSASPGLRARTRHSIRRSSRPDSIPGRKWHQSRNARLESNARLAPVREFISSRLRNSCEQRRREINVIKEKRESTRAPGWIGVKTLCISLSLSLSLKEALDGFSEHAVQARKRFWITRRATLVTRRRRATEVEDFRSPRLESIMHRCEGKSCVNELAWTSESRRFFASPASPARFVRITMPSGARSATRSESRASSASR